MALINVFLAFLSLQCVEGLCNAVLHVSSVYRCNLPPLSKEYVKDVGTRTHLVTANPSIIERRYSASPDTVVLMKQRVTSFHCVSIHGEESMEA